MLFLVMLDTMFRTAVGRFSATFPILKKGHALALDLQDRIEQTSPIGGDVQHGRKIVGDGLAHVGPASIP
jgi:hypothetical protein